MGKQRFYFSYGLICFISLITYHWKLKCLVYFQDAQIRSKYTDEEFNSVSTKVEREYIETLQVRCYREKQYRKL